MNIAGAIMVLLCPRIQAEIKILSDQSELVQVYNSLRAEVARTREDYCKCEVSSVVLQLELLDVVCRFVGESSRCGI